MKDKDNRILVHACCAICSGYPIIHLRKLGYEPVAYFFNPNIHPKSEYTKRLKALKILCNALHCELIVDDYMPDLYCEIMQGYENHAEGSERCKRCFELRLLKTAQKARELGIDNYTTSISISPHKNFNVLKEVGKFFSGYFNIHFMDLDFKKQGGFLKTCKISRDLNLYRQNYCGCEMSMKRLSESKESSVDWMKKEASERSKSIKTKS